MIEDTFIFSANTNDDVFGEIEKRVQWTLGISNTILRRTGSNFKLFYKDCSKCELKITGPEDAILVQIRYDPRNLEFKKRAYEALQDLVREKTDTQTKYV
ncbi:hypothetical protein J4477_04545 [Candidatus Pacearchaeota archaeon]|nr:hypothetical protein [Candidatus Pacearchaeota archaeon]